MCLPCLCLLSGVCMCVCMRLCLRVHVCVCVCVCVRAALEEQYAKGLLKLSKSTLADQEEG